MGEVVSLIGHIRGREIAELQIRKSEETFQREAFIYACDDWTSIKDVASRLGVDPVKFLTTVVDYLISMPTHPDPVAKREAA